MREDVADADPVEETECGRLGEVVELLRQVARAGAREAAVPVDEALLVEDREIHRERHRLGTVHLLVDHLIGRQVV